MVNYDCQLEPQANRIKVKLSDEDGNEHEVFFEFDPHSGRYDCAELEALEQNFGAAWLEGLEAHVRKLVDRAVIERRKALHDDPWG